jgi:phenylacetic acid degradation operon negative regulatory protein
VEEIAQALRLAKHVEVFRATHVGFTSREQLVAQCWDLAAVNRRYAAFIDRWRPDFSHCRSCGMSGVKGPVHRPCTAPAECFRRRFRLVHEYRAFPLTDPFLPRPLLPAGWKGEEAAALFDRYHAVLADPAVRYVDDVCRTGDTAVAAVAA